VISLHVCPDGSWRRFSHEGLDRSIEIHYTCGVNLMLTTSEAADAVGLDRVTLQGWIAAGKVKAPRLVLRSGRAVRLWRAIDIERLKKVKSRIHRKGRGRKPKLKR